ncbi:MAG: amidohydrolase family protein [Pseudomonadales bacterium]
MSLRIALVSAALCTVLVAPLWAASNYDIVILNGRVIDPETRLDAVRNVGIRDGVIAKISKRKLRGNRVIEAKNLIVAPGFIDTHNHGSVTLHGGKLSLRNGVTTSMDLEAGAMNIASWYQEREAKWPLNYGTTVSQEFSRAVVLDSFEQDSLRDMRDFSHMRGTAGDDGESSWSTHVATVDEMNQILRLLDQGLVEGAIGIGALLGYGSNGITSREMYETQRTAAQYGRITSVHTRFASTTPPTEFSIGGAEVLWNAFLLDAPMLLNHFNINSWPLIQEMLVKARERGMNVWGEVYPYTSGSTSVGADFLDPDQWTKNFGPPEKTILDPQTGKFLSRDELITARRETPGMIIIGYLRPEEWVVPWLQLEGVAIAGDGMLAEDDQGELLAWDAPFTEGAFHPRTAGTQGRVLRLARENELSWLHIISMLSYTPAKHLGAAGLQSMQQRGRMQEGMVADITVFNPETVTDNATFTKGENGLPSTGIPYVLVNGQLVVDRSTVLPSLFPGQAIRYPVEKNSRFKPLLDEGNWVLKSKHPH